MKNDGSIRLSKKHGLAPVLCACPLCGKDSGEIALLGALADRLPSFRGSISERVPGSPCDSCRRLIEDEGAVGVIAEDSFRSLMFSREGARRIFKGNPTGVLFASEELFDRILSHIPPEILRATEATISGEGHA